MLHLHMQRAVKRLKLFIFFLIIFFLYLFEPNNITLEGVNFFLKNHNLFYRLQVFLLVKTISNI